MVLQAQDETQYRFTLDQAVTTLPSVCRNLSVRVIACAMTDSLEPTFTHEQRFNKQLRVHHLQVERIRQMALCSHYCLQNLRDQRLRPCSKDHAADPLIEEDPDYLRDIDRERMCRTQGCNKLCLCLRSWEIMT